MQKNNAQLIILQGSEKGRILDITNKGAQLGRSSDNDITINDPILSRRQCRFSFNQQKRLVVEDLDSANGTLVNDLPVTSIELSIGDRITIGDTLLLVTQAPPAIAPDSPVPPTPEPAKADPSKTPGEAEPSETPIFVDLGFNEPDPVASSKSSARTLIWLIGAAALLVLGALLIFNIPTENGTETISKIIEPSILPLEIYYEKVEGDSNSIFRYSMQLDPNMALSIAIDDLTENRHVREETVVGTNLIRELSREIGESGFFSLNSSYEGVPRDDLLNTWDITIVQNKRVKRCRVSNRVEPAIFQEVRERLETFGKNELGIWAIQFSRDKLIDLAYGAYIRGANLFDERNIAYGNSFNAIRRFREATAYLETIDPKPDFYADLIALQSQSEEDLLQRYEEQRFIADHSLKLKDWNGAARELRILREIIPDTDDPRNTEATQKLIDVENRLKMRGRP